MTREEAKEFLITISYSLGNMAIEYLTKKDGEKMREAIKALDQPPCEDAISRQAVLEIAKSSKSNWIDNSVLFKKINALPPITLQQKIGHWIALGNYDDLGNESSYKCSECGDIDTYHDNFCPNCGCRMVKLVVWFS